jgi:hypothetical protein
MDSLMYHSVIQRSFGRYTVHKFTKASYIGQKNCENETHLNSDGYYSTLQ